jgi:hypothetical protein
VITPADAVHEPEPDSKPPLTINWAWLAMLKLTAVEVATLPAASYALAVSAWLPLVRVVELSVAEYGAVVSVLFNTLST